MAGLLRAPADPAERVVVEEPHDAVRPNPDEHAGHSPRPGGSTRASGHRAWSAQRRLQGAREVLAGRTGAPWTLTVVSPVGPIVTRIVGCRQGPHWLSARRTVPSAWAMRVTR